MKLPAVALLLAVMLTAVIPAGSADAPRGPAQDVLLLGESGPVLLRWQLLIDGQPCSAAWQHYLDKLFADLDRNGDGSLNRPEATRTPSADFLQAFLQGSLNLEAAAATVPFNQLDADGDGRGSRAELAAYCGRCGLERLRVLPAPDQGQAGALTEALFYLLDRDLDGKLSSNELKNAADTLHRVDLNEDEWLTPDELLLHRPTRAAPVKPPTLETLGFLPLEPTGWNETVSRNVLARYAGKAKLDAGGLKELLTRVPQREVQARLGKLHRDEPRLEVSGADVRRLEAGAAAFDLGGLTLEVQAGPADGSVRGLHAFYRQQYEAAAADKRGFLERKQTADAATLAALFALADRDADSKLTEKEFDAFLDLHALGAASFVSLTLTDQSLGLFDLLDEMRDGRLSLRELHTAWERLRSFDRNGDGQLSRDEFPRQLRARLAQGKANLRPAQKASRTAERVQARGPAWFQKMDRNGDGQVSRREFLGPERLFDQLDADGDGLLGPDEAERAPT